MPSSIKSKIKEYYDADLDVFRRKSQAIWNAHKESALQSNQVNYNRYHRPDHYTKKNNYQRRMRSNPQQESYPRNNNTNNNLGHQQQNRNNYNSNQSFQRYRDNERRD